MCSDLFRVLTRITEVTGIDDEKAWEHIKSVKFYNILVKDFASKMWNFLIGLFAISDVVVVTSNGMPYWPNFRIFVLVLKQEIVFFCENKKSNVGESWGMTNDGEGRTPHFQQKWKRGHNENSLWQLLFIHSLVVCSDLGDLPKFCSENFQKTGKWPCVLFCTCDFDWAAH